MDRRNDAMTSMEDFLAEAERRDRSRQARWDFVLGTLALAAIVAIAVVFAR